MAKSFTEMWKRGLPFVSQLLHANVFVYIGLHKISKSNQISCCKRSTITQKCCWPRLEKKVDKKYIKIGFIYGPIDSIWSDTRLPSVSIRSTYGKSRKL